MKAQELVINREHLERSLPLLQAELAAAEAGADGARDGMLQQRRELRDQVIRYARNHSVGKYQSCMF